MYYDHLWSKRERELLEAALPLVARVGARSMSFQDLADAVRIRKASVHYHFSTKSDLLTALISGYEMTLTEDIRSLVRDCNSGDNKLRLYVGQLANLVGAYDGKHICPCTMLSAEVVNLKQEVADRLAKFFNHHAKALTAILVEGRHDGSLRFRGPAEPLAWMILSLVEGAMLVARVTGGEELFFEMQKALERQLFVPYQERPPVRNLPVAAEGPVENEGSVVNTGAAVWRQAAVVDSNPETLPASIEHAPPETGPCALACLKDLPASTSDAGTLPSGEPDRD